LLRAYIDWSPFFYAWQLKSLYPAVLSDVQYGEAAQALFTDANALLDELIEQGSLQAQAVFGFYPANRVTADDVEIYTDDTRTQGLMRFHHLRQQKPKPDQKPNKSLADFIAPVGHKDYLGAFVVTAGLGLPDLLEVCEKNHDDYRSLLLKSIADRLAEAAAEYLHEHIRKHAWGYAADEQFNITELITEQYRGIRPAPGYPACPDHTEKTALFNLLHPERIGVSLTESLAMWPASSVSGFWYAHPEAHYFQVGKINEDQLADYAQRKGLPLAEMRQWLHPIL
jgi:5-methyltetrahydrofolate--homocysteine methyltransferase